MKNSTLTPVTQAKPKPKKAKAEAPKSDEAYTRNFTKAGTPRLNATSGSGSGSMGQRR